MLLIDSHCHVSERWYEPVETLLFQMDRKRVERAVLVQLLGQCDNGYQQACVRLHPARLASVVTVDVNRADAVERLAALAGEGAVGVRLRPDARSPGSDPLAIWRAAQALGLAVSCVGNSALFCEPSFADLMLCLPGVTVVLEHLGGTSSPDVEEAARAARRRVFDLARFPNVYLKLPGLGELCPRSANWHESESPFEGAMLQTLASALEHFGPERLMWGSDFPPVAAREGYGRALDDCLRATAELGAAAQAHLFGGTAQRVFHL